MDVVFSLSLVERAFAFEHITTTSAAGSVRVFVTVYICVQHTKSYQIWLRERVMADTTIRRACLIKNPVLMLTSRADVLRMSWHSMKAWNSWE